MNKFIVTFLLLIMVMPLNAQHFLMKTYGQENTDRGVGTEKALNNNGYVMVGYTESFNSIGEDVYVVRTDMEGNLMWQKTYGKAGDDNAWAIKKHLIIII